MKKRTLLLGHSYWGRGGAEIAAMCLIQELCVRYRLDIVTRGGWDIEELNRCAGTNVRDDQIGAVKYVPCAPRENGFGGAIWHGLFLRYCRVLAPKYDLCITASRVINWGQPAIHFLSDVAWNLPLQRKFDCVEFDGSSGLAKKAYFYLARLAAGQTCRMPEEHDLFIANSEWTASESAPYLSRPAVVIYPPVTPANEGGVFGERKLASFICLGRVAPEKEIEAVFDILQSVRAQGHAVTLDVVGGGDGAYFDFIQKKASSMGDWIRMCGPMYGEEKEGLLRQADFGISACIREAFGMATVEMMQAGVITVVPSEGAQSEIVKDPLLIYEGEDNAVRKITSLLDDPSLKDDLRHSLYQEVSKYNTSRFAVEIEDVLESEWEFLAQEVRSSATDQ
ncbi:glycosyltransferase family 4 protein [Puniceicoccaceae bacterium]|nr:glycosyltransferase family 4 protein [Puniceicoccaceae bacterium]